MWSGPAITVIGMDVPGVGGALNAVSPHARAKVSVRVHPEQDAAEAQAAVVEHLNRATPFGVRVDAAATETGQGFAARTGSDVYVAAKAAWAAAWGTERVLLDEFQKATLAMADLFGRLAPAYGGAP